MKILITGASGFISSFVMDEAVARGYDVAAMDRPRSEHDRCPPLVMQKPSVVSAGPDELRDHH